MSVLLAASTCNSVSTISALMMHQSSLKASSEKEMEDLAHSSAT